MNNSMYRNLKRNNITPQLLYRILTKSCKDYKTRTYYSTISITPSKLYKNLHNCIRYNSTKENPPTIQMESDIFGEPITYILNNNKTTINESNIIWDEYILSIATRNKSSCTKSNCNSMGISIQSSHSYAMLWSDLLCNILELKHNEVKCPMLVIGCVLPTLCIGGVEYLRYLDEFLYKHVRNKDVSMISLVNDILQEEGVTKREMYYIECIKHLLNSDHEKALYKLVDIITIAPGDIFALSQIMDLSSTIGNSIIPLRASGIVTSYLQDRSNESSSSLGLSYVSLGYAVGKRYKEAELYADLSTSKIRNKSLSTPITAFSGAILYHTEGRIEEGISLLYNFDGLNEYNTTSGYYFYDSLLCCYSILFLLQRDCKSDNALGNCLRLYNDSFTRVLDCCGVNREKWVQGLTELPIPRYQEIVKDSSSSFFSMFSFLNDEEKPPSSETTKTTNSIEGKATLTKDDLEEKVTHCLTYLPPTPQLLSHATIVLLYLTLSNYEKTKKDTENNMHYLWKDLYVSWKHISSMYNNQLSFCPLAKLTSSLFIQYPNGTKLEEAFYTIGTLLDIPQYTIQDDKLEPNNNNQSKDKNEWNKVMNNLYESYYLKQNYTIWDIQISSLLDFLLYNSMLHLILDENEEDEETKLVLYKARAICSEMIVLKPNNSEYWWRYSYVLKLLKDEVASDHALEMCRNLVSSSGSNRMLGFYEKKD